MELGAIIEHIQRLPKQAQTALLGGLKLTQTCRSHPRGDIFALSTWCFAPNQSGAGRRTYIT
ncbi:hypothetical protein JCM15765_07310 [Paradesulfitobacterium aromaticivorans]